MKGRALISVSDKQGLDELAKVRSRGFQMAQPADGGLPRDVCLACSLERRCICEWGREALSIAWWKG